MFDSLKTWLTSSIVKKYIGSVVRSVMLLVSGYLLSQGLADAETAKALTGALATILLNLLDTLLNSPDLIGSLGLGGIAQWWSLRQKKAQVALEPKSKKGK